MSITVIAVIDALDVHPDSGSLRIGVRVQRVRIDPWHVRLADNARWRHADLGASLGGVPLDEIEQAAAMDPRARMASPALIEIEVAIVDDA